MAGGLRFKDEAEANEFLANLPGAKPVEEQEKHDWSMTLLGWVFWWGMGLWAGLIIKGVCH